MVTQASVVPELIFWLMEYIIYKSIINIILANDMYYKYNKNGNL